MHRCPTFVSAARLPSTSLTYVRTRGTSAVYIADLRSYALHVCRLHRDLRSYALQKLVGIHRCPTFVRAVRLPSTSPTSVGTRCRTSLVRTMSDICMSSASAAITAGYIRTHCSSAVNIAELHSYALQNLVCMCRCPTFVRAAPLPSTSLTYVRTCGRTSLEFTTVLHSYALLVCRQNRRPPFVCIAEPRWYVPLSNVRTRCRTALLRTCVLHSYMLHVCRHSTFIRIAEPRWYAPLSYIRTRCSSAINIADLRSYALLNHVATHFHPTFLHSPSQPP